MAKIKKLVPPKTNNKQDFDESMEAFLSLLQKAIAKEFSHIDDEDLDDDLGDEDYEDDDYEDDYDYMVLPEIKWIGEEAREFHIRIKLNDAPVKIWRELAVPSNISLELLAHVLMVAMGWEREHPFLYSAKYGLRYANASIRREMKNSFIGFLSQETYVSSENTSLEMVLQPKNGRIKFEYDFGDSWVHDLWVKGAREYADGEKPSIKILKGQGACPPEDCGGVWGYAELLELNKKKRKTADEKERLEWYFIDKGYDPEECDLEWLQDDIEFLWKEIDKEGIEEEEEEK